MATAAETILAGMALGVAQRSVAGNDSCQSLCLPEQRGRRLAVSAPGLGDVVGGLVRAKPVLLALLVEPGGQIAARNICELRPFLFAKPVAGDHPCCFLCCADDSECVDYCSARCRGGLSDGVVGDNGRAGFFGSSEKKEETIKLDCAYGRETNHEIEDH